MTTFSWDAVEFDTPWGPSRLWVEGNSKIALTSDGFTNPPCNALSLVEIKDCPGSTPTCRAVCYATKTAAANPPLHARRCLNSALMPLILASPDAWETSVAALGRYWYEAFLQKTILGVRFQVAGDLVSAAHARWISDVCRYMHPVPAWLYSRSLSYLGHLDAKNLVVNISADRDNMMQAATASRQHGLRLCYLAKKGETLTNEMFVDGDVLFPDYPLRHDREWLKSLPMRLRKMVCPPDLVGQSERARCGPCRRCLV